MVERFPTAMSVRESSTAQDSIGMLTRSARCRKLLWGLASLAALGCGGDQGPHPSLRLSILGHVLSAEPAPVPVAGATVALREFQGLESSRILVQTTTDQAGAYQLTYIFTSICKAPDQPGFWIEAAAERYEMKSTISFDVPFSDPPVYCTNDPQTIDLSLQPLGWLRVLTGTTGSPQDPDGYAPVLTGKFPYPLGEMSLAYPMGANDEQVIELLPGQFSLELTDVAGNCTVVGDNPRTVVVAARDTAVTAFQVTCAP